MTADPLRPEGGRTDQGPPPEPLHELTFGRRVPLPVEARSSRASTSADADLAAIEGRCRLKAEAARRAADRQRRIRGRVDVQVEEEASMEREFSEWADKLTDCFYWLETPDGSTPDLALLDDVGGCFEAVAEASSLVSQEVRRGSIERSLPLLAEAQSALRRALQKLQSPDDPDQLAAYEWVREAAARHHVYLKRFMRADDLADPAAWPDLLARIEARAGGDRQARRRPRPLEATVSHEPIAEVKEARRLLRGRSIVLIGGIRRPSAQESLKTALGLEDLIWVETKEHQSIEAFEPVIARPDVALVLLAIRWSSHAFGEVHRYCDRHGKPLVRLPAGYGPNPVAAQILAQAGERLAGGRPRPPGVSGQE